MRAVQVEIRDWLLAQQDWLQETAERLLKQGSLIDDDLHHVIGMLKTPAGRTVTMLRSFDELVAAPNIGSAFRLVEIAEVLGIENLCPRAPLNFGSGNLTVIYGHNGSGKSSYTRILKKVSGKPRVANLKSNVFQAPPLEQKCRITYQLGDGLITTEWRASDAPIDAIRAIDVFDSDEASHYLSKESSAAYTPPVVSMFESLALACDRIRDLLQAEQEKQTSSLPVVPPAYSATLAAKRFGALRADLKEKEIEQILSWTEGQDRKLGEIKERLKVIDPAALSKQKRATKTQAEQIVTDLTVARQAFGSEGIAAVRVLQTEAKEKRKIAEEAAHLATAKLEGVGSPTWRALWEAARAYSLTAYPTQIFPATDDARCVLCHQEVGPDARRRLRDFEAYVQGKLEADAKTAEEAYEAALKSLPVVPDRQLINTRCEAAGLNSDQWNENLSTFWEAASQARARLLAGEVEEQAESVLDIAPTVDALLEYCEQLESQATQSEKDAQGFDRVQAEKEKDDLEAQQWVSQQAEAVRTEIERLKILKEYDDWKALAHSRKISLKAGEVAEKVITQAYVSRFNQELQLLGATRIKVEIVKTRAERGRVLHQLRLRGARDARIMPDSVLSEGERRVISLAAFLADVAHKPQVAPFVFDDPISSLDHDFEWSVASRLAALAKDRQVLVLTHRLSLYGAMEDVAKKMGDEWKKQHFRPLCIEAYAGAAGQPVDQTTWNAKTEKANNILLDRLGLAKRAGEAGGGEAYRGMAQGICSDFRKLLERTVEDDLLNEVVKRHRRSVTTENRLGALPFIEPADCLFIDALMTKYSCYEHSQSQEMPILIPEEPELRGDIEALKQWRKSFIDRRKAVVAA